MEAVPLPANFIYLQNALTAEKGKEQYNVIGVCVDFLPAVKSGGTDYTIKFTLHDQSWETGLGMVIRFFNKNVTVLPDIRDQGDVVILRNVKTFEFNGTITAVSNSASSWVVLPYAQLEQMNSSEDLKTHARRLPMDPSLHQHQGALPNPDELLYAKWIARQECASAWRPLPPATALQVSQIMSSSGGRPPPRQTKFRWIEELDLPDVRGHIFVDLLGEVRRKYSPNNSTVELYLTDYTSHEGLYDYRYDDNSDSRDGDPFGYIESTSAKWPGPWGRMTINVTLWDTQAEYATSNVNEGNFVYLRNVQIKMDKSGSRLEGQCRQDRAYPTKINIEIKRAREDKENGQLKELLSRKLKYEEKASAENLRFSRHAQTALKRPREGGNEPAGESKNKKTRGRNRRKQKPKFESQQGEENSAAVHDEVTLKPNTNVRCNYPDVACKTIEDILDSGTLERKTANNKTFWLPFQNCTYKAKVRVVDFFPDNIADFAAPRRITDYDILSDVENDGSSDVEVMPADGDEVKWEWRFFLLVEDARSPSDDQEQRAQMELLVAENDGEFLLKMDACDLRDKENAQHLATLKEKLFLLWGDLQEKKEESSTQDSLAIKPNACPFECLIKEYGVAARRTCEGQGEGEVAKDSLRYDRMFRLFGTTI